MVTPLRDDDGTLLWFKEYVQWFKDNKTSFLKNPSNTAIADSYIILLEEMLETCTPKQEKYSWEK